MSIATAEWTTQFTCPSCKSEIVVCAEQVSLGAFEYDDASFTHTSRKPYVHCSNCSTPHKLSASEIPAQVLCKATEGKR